MPCTRSTRKQRAGTHRRRPPGSTYPREQGGQQWVPSPRVRRKEHAVPSARPLQPRSGRSEAANCRVRTDSPTCSGAQPVAHRARRFDSRRQPGPLPRPDFTPAPHSRFATSVGDSRERASCRRFKAPHPRAGQRHGRGRTARAVGGRRRRCAAAGVDEAGGSTFQALFFLSDGTPACRLNPSMSAHGG